VEQDTERPLLLANKLLQKVARIFSLRVNKLNVRLEELLKSLEKCSLKSIQCTLGVKQAEAEGLINESSLMFDALSTL
jgi:hypothetical protein